MRGPVTQKQVIRTLSADHASLLDEQRAALEDIKAQMVAHGDASAEMASLDFAQLLLDVGLIPLDAVAYQEAIGVVIGDALVERGFIWRSVTDQWGDMPAICHPAKKAVANPMSSVVKRFDRGEIVFDVRHFVDETARIIEELVAKSEVAGYDAANPANEEGARPEPRPFMNFIRGLTGRKSIN